MKKTRDELFQKSFDLVVQDYIEMRNINTREWSLKKTTRKKNSSLHKYRFVIPRSYLQYAVSRYTDPDGFIHQVEEVYTYQHVPDADLFIYALTDHFEDYYVKIEDDVVSYVKLEHKPNPDSEDFVATIEVKYINGVFPYPVPPTDLEIANQRIMRLSTEIINLKMNAEIGLAVYTECVEARAQVMSNDIRDKAILIESKNMMLSRMKDKLKELYPKHDPCECPVCYTQIPGEKLVITDCCHYICSNCSENCTRCPLCRTEF
jgi:hypothetical protein